VLFLRRPSDERLQQILEDQQARPFPYPSVGATATGEVPDGYHHDRFETNLAPDRFDAAREALRAWAPQRGAGIRVYPGDPVAADQAFVLVLPLPGPGCAVAPGRVVYVIDEPDRFGFAYGTLPAHPAWGEEAFMVTRSGGRVRFQVVAFSRPHDPLARLGGPLARAVQVRTIRSYLRSMEAAT